MGQPSKSSVMMAEIDLGFCFAREGCVNHVYLACRSKQRVIHNPCLSFLHPGCDIHFKMSSMISKMHPIVCWWCPFNTVPKQLLGQRSLTYSPTVSFPVTHSWTVMGGPNGCKQVWSRCHWHWTSKHSTRACVSMKCWPWLRGLAMQPRTAAGKSTFPS